MQYAPLSLANQPVNGLTCGIDWARDDHAVAIVDAGGRPTYRGSFEDKAKRLKKLIAVLRGRGVGEVAIERPDGPVVDTLLAAGITVVVIHPNQVRNLRSRYGSAGKKQDPVRVFLAA